MTQQLPPTSDIRQFAPLLLAWYRPGARPMPWKGEKDPYRIWISEVILQQTRVEQGWPYYERFIMRFPTVQALAEAHEDEVLKMWQGLGYYSRARNLHKGARQVVEWYDGSIPADHGKILAVSGIGPYTAAAIASFAFGLPYAVVDGNVIRVLSRVFGAGIPWDTTAGKKYFQALADAVLDRDRPGVFNQAMMDFGATVCTPLQPVCPTCPFSHTCRARKEDAIYDYPVRDKKISRKERFLHYFIIHKDDKYLLFKRPEGDVYAGMYEFLLHESGSRLDTGDAERVLDQAGIRGRIVREKVFRPHILTHQRLITAFFLVEAEELPLISGAVTVDHSQLGKYAVPKYIQQIIDLWLK